MRKTPQERFWQKVEKTDGCWNWKAALYIGTGYGRFCLGGGYMLAHRFSYLIVKGPIQDGLDLDHVCRNRACVNPDHLRPVSRRENLLAPGSQSLAAKHAAKTHCPSGHPYSPENTYVWKRNGQRKCKACASDRQKRRRVLSKTNWRDVAIIGGDLGL
jgi:hypothetical protein